MSVSITDVSVSFNQAKIGFDTDSKVSLEGKVSFPPSMPAGPDAILLEDGCFLLLEDGCKILLEDTVIENFIFADGDNFIFADGDNFIFAG